MLKLNGEIFTVGRSKFLDRVGQRREETTAKIYVKIGLDGIDATHVAQLDTGAAWSILQTEIAEAIGALNEAGEAMNISTRDGIIKGQLVRRSLTILADEGESIVVDATVFVSRHWARGTFIGYCGLLERIRIGLDAPANNFYFGPAGK